MVRQRLVGICAAANTRLDRLPIYVITAPRLLLDLPQDREQLRQTVASLNPALLILDPFIRLHRSDENASKEVAPLLGYLRQLQREFQIAVLLVHHVRKGSATKRPGQALRGRRLADFFGAPPDNADRAARFARAQCDTR